MAGRKLHLIDVENVFGGGSGKMKSGEIARRWNIYITQAVTLGHDDVVFAASGVALADQVEGLPTRVTKLVREGHDGADLALLEAFDQVFEPGAFDELVVASGDWAFARAAKTALSAGTRVHFVFGGGPPSVRLLKTGGRRTYIRSRTQVRQNVSARSKYWSRRGTA